MVRWIDALARTRQHVAGALGRWFRRGAKADFSREEIEELLVLADVPVSVATGVAAELHEAYRGLDVAWRNVLREMLIQRLKRATPSQPFVWPQNIRPFVVLVVGVNGSGKTTTIAKLAHQAAKSGLVPLLAATDTYRAAGADQLKLWAERLGVEVVAGQPGADAAAVAFDATDAAIARGRDVLLVDTAGRMHTRQPLMRELQKVRTAIGKRLPGAPHETWLVLDATLGQNALAQAKAFHDHVPLTGIILAKLDTSARAGFVFGFDNLLPAKLLWVGLGESPDDLAPFDPVSFVDALLQEEPE